MKLSLTPWRLLHLFLLLTCISHVATAQVPAEVSGHVTNAQTGHAIANVRIEVMGRAAYVESETDGSFTLRGLEPGSYTLHVRAIGYVPQNADVELVNGRSTLLDITLQPMTSLLTRQLTGVVVRATQDSGATGATGAVTFDRHAIEASGKRDLGELLQTTPGVVVTQDGGPGAASYISIRGSGANEVLVLVNGSPVNSTITGETDLSQITLANVERVTLLPGAQSARYGSGALAGVILIETRRADQDISAMAKTGAWGEREGALTLGTSQLWNSMNNLRTSASVTADARTSQGDFPYAIPDLRGGGTTQRVNNDNGSRSLSGTAAVTEDSATLQVRAEWQTMARGLPGSIVQPSTTGRERESHVAGGIDGHWLHGPFVWTGNVDLNHEYAAFADPKPPFGGVYDDDVNADGVTISTTGTASSSLGNVAMGAETRTLDVTSTELAPGAPRWQRELGTWTSLHTARALSSDVEVAGDVTARLDWDTFVHGTTVSPRAEVTLSDRHVSLSTSIGQGFTPPSLADQFFHEGVLVRPNPNLQPERVHDDFETRMDLHNMHAGDLDVSGSVAAYRADIDGMILWLPNFQFIWSPTNFDVKRSGVDVSGRVALSPILSSLGVDLQGTLSQSDVTYTGAVLTGQVAYRPRTTANVTAGVTRASARLELTTRYVGTRRTVAGSDLNLLDPYWLTDAKLVVPLTRSSNIAYHIDATVGLENVLNRPAAMLVDYPFPGRTWSVALHIHRAGTHLPSEG